MAFLAPLLAPLLEPLGVAMVSELSTEIGIPAAASGLIAGTALGVGLNKGLNAGQELIENAIGKEAVDVTKKNINDILATNSAVLNQDTSYFLQQAKERYRAKKKNDVIDFKTEDPRDHPLSHDPKADEANGQLLSNAANSVSSAMTKKVITGKQVAKFIGNLANGLAQSAQASPIGEKEQILKAAEGDENLAQVMGSFLASKIPNDDEYNAIKAVYNGRGLQIFQRYDPVTQGLIFTLIDEVGTRAELPQNKGFILPALYGVFLGPYTANNAMPIDYFLPVYNGGSNGNNVVPLDLYCAFHDQTFLKGFFTPEAYIGDLKLISRISQNFSKMNEVQKPYARTALLYFSTMAQTIHAIKGNVDGVDLHTFVNGPIVETGQSPITQSKEEFINELESGLISHMTNDSVITTYSRGNMMLAQEFGNIMVELL